MSGHQHSPDHVSQSSEDVSAAQFWEDRYAAGGRVWSGKVNATTAAVAGDLPVGDALELGCGEGGDAVWLAEQGWTVTAVDISATAVARGADGAAERGVGENITWIAHDLSTWTTDAEFDLLTASFFHSTVELDRSAIVRRAAERIRPGGHVLVVSHVFETDDDIPPWAPRRDDGTSHMPHLPGPEQDLADLDFDPNLWSTVRCEIRTRDVTGPDGSQTHALKDGVLLLQRRP